LIAHFRLYDEPTTLVIEHRPGPPGDEWKYAKQQVALRLEAMGIENPADDLYRWGDWLDERDP
jgi:hypothetical protein